VGHTGARKQYHEIVPDLHRVDDQTLDETERLRSILVRQNNSPRVAKQSLPPCNRKDLEAPTRKGIREGPRQVLPGEAAASLLHLASSAYEFAFWL
jgi:hypothetical protein